MKLYQEIVVEAKDRTRGSERRQNSLLILAYHRAIKREKAAIARGHFSQVGRIAAERLIQRFEERLLDLSSRVREVGQ